MIDIALLTDLCRIPGAPGYEEPIRKYVKEQIEPLVDEVRVDAMGNLVAVKTGKEDKSLMVTAHLDEISFIVSHIDDDGFLRFQPLGGFDPKTLTAQRVIIHGREDVMGVMGCKPVHLMTKEEKDKPLQLKDYFIDTGLSKEDVKKKIDIGDVITRERELIRMGECVNAKSLDNRISVYVLIELLRSLKGKTIPYDLYAVFTVQEEVGLRGAKTAASAVDPNFGINLDVTVAFDLPGAQSQEKVSKLGEGTAIKILDGTTICDVRMVRFMKDCAESGNIKWQAEVLPAGGTDTAMVQRAGRNGSIAGGISIPCRNLHQVIEMVHIKDVEASIALLKECVQRIDSFDHKF
ncbi:MAG: M42 family metallopeptidase [Saprospiraceae bacterium]|nr:M42 family metallopeptidase [Saprospiraceae bacterium]